MIEPLTPANADLQDFAFMPLHVARLRDSDLASEVSPEACWYAVLLWCASWHQLPAGSLPDNEIVLTKLCGLGRDVRTFRKHRDGAMRGFIKCSDGRLYHPVVAEQVHASWTAKLQQRWRSELARIKKANQRNGTALEGPTYEAFLLAIGEGTSPPSPQSVPGDTEFCPSGHRIQETGTGTGILEEEANASFVGSEIATEEPVARKPKPWEASAAFQSFWKASGPQMRSRTSQSKVWPVWKRVAAEIGAETLHAALKRYIAQDADYQRTGGPGLHGWLTDSRWEHWIPTDAQTQTAAKRFPDEPTRAAVAGKLGEDFARKWIDPCGWEPDRSRIVAPMKFVADQLSREGPALKTLGILAVRIAQAEGAAA